MEPILAVKKNKNLSGEDVQKQRRRRKKNQKDRHFVAARDVQSSGIESNTKLSRGERRRFGFKAAPKASVEREDNKQAKETIGENLEGRVTTSLAVTQMCAFGGDAIESSLRSDAANESEIVNGGSNSEVRKVSSSMYRHAIGGEPLIGDELCRYPSVDDIAGKSSFTAPSHLQHSLFHGVEGDLRVIAVPTNLRSQMLSHLLSLPSTSLSNTSKCYQDHKHQQQLAKANKPLRNIPSNSKHQSKGSSLVTLGKFLICCQLATFERCSLEKIDRSTPAVHCISCS